MEARKATDLRRLVHWCLAAELGGLCRIWRINSTHPYYAPSSCRKHHSIILAHDTAFLQSAEIDSREGTSDFVFTLFTLVESPVLPHTRFGAKATLVEHIFVTWMNTKRNSRVSKVSRIQESLDGWMGKNEIAARSEGAYRSAYIGWCIPHFGRKRCYTVMSLWPVYWDLNWWWYTVRAFYRSIVRDIAPF